MKLLILASILLAGCLSGASGITSSGTDGHSETHIPVGDGTCYLIVGDTTNRTHCPTR